MATRASHLLASALSGAVAERGRGLGLGLLLAGADGRAAALRQEHAAVGLHVVLEGRDRAVVHQPEAVGDQFDEMRVVADEDDRAAVFGEGLDQRLAAFDVEMVGRLVEDDQMRRVDGGDQQAEPRLLAARQPRDLGRRDVGAETAGGEAGALFRRGLERAEAGDVLERRLVEMQFVDLVLGEIADTQFGRGDLAPGHRVETVGEEFRERGFALAVGAEKGDAVVLVDAQVKAAQDRLAAVADIGVFQADDRGRHLLGGREAESRDVILDDGRERLHPLQRLDAGLGLTGLGRLGFEAVDEGLHVGAGGVLLLLFGDELFELGAARRVERVVGALVEVELLAVEMQNRADRAVQEVAVMADDEDGVGVACEEVLQPDRAFEIEIVGRLVEQQDVGPREEHRGERHAHPPAAGEVRAGTGLGRRVEAEAVQDRGGAGLGGMRLDVGEARLDFGDARGRGRRVGLRKQGGAFDVGFEHGVDEAVAGRGGLLGHSADAGAARGLDLAAVEGELAPDQAEKRGFSRAVAADESHLVTGRDHRRGVVEELFALQREADVLE